MNPPISREPSYGVRHEPMRSAARSSFCVMPHDPRPARNTSFIFGRSDSRAKLRHFFEVNRLHIWAMIVALSSSIVGTTLLLMAILG